jgi:hypothetical protein
VDVVVTQENLPGENRDDLPVRAEGGKQRNRLLLPDVQGAGLADPGVLKPTAPSIPHPFSRGGQLEGIDT